LISIYYLNNPFGHQSCEAATYHSEAAPPLATVQGGNTLRKLIPLYSQASIRPILKILKSYKSRSPFGTKIASPHLKMKHLFLFLFIAVLIVSCGHKTEIQPGIQDTVNLVPPAALDTLQLHDRPADSLLKTKRY